MDYAVFLSYRRADTAGHAGRICDDLKRRLGYDAVFRDIDAIAAGADFVGALQTAISAARVCIVLIGDTWLEVRAADGGRRLDDPGDHVRREVEMALAKPELTVIPVLVEGAQMPQAQDLPPTLQALTRLQAIELSDSRWEYDMARLAHALQRAGIGNMATTRVPRWFAPLIGVMAVLVIAITAWCLRDPAINVEHYGGLWYMPNGSYWTVRQDTQGEGLWVEETHYESQQVWKRGPGTIDGDGLAVELKLVFDKEPFSYRYRMRLADDRQTLLGTVVRSDRSTESTLALTRARH